LVRVVQKILRNFFRKKKKNKLTEKGGKNEQISQKKQTKKLEDGRKKYRKWTNGDLVAKKKPTEGSVKKKKKKIINKPKTGPLRVGANRRFLNRGTRGNRRNALTTTDRGFPLLKRRAKNQKTTPKNPPKKKNKG